MTLWKFFHIIIPPYSVERTSVRSTHNTLLQQQQYNKYSPNHQLDRTPHVEYSGQLYPEALSPGGTTLLEAVQGCLDGGDFARKGEEADRGVSCRKMGITGGFNLCTDAHHQALLGLRDEWAPRARLLLVLLLLLLLCFPSSEEEVRYEKVWCGSGQSDNNN